MPNELIKNQYISLVKLVKLHHQQPINNTILNATHSFNHALFKVIESHPDLLFSQTQLYKPQVPFAYNLIFNAAIYTCLTSIRNRLDHAVTLQLMNACISILAQGQGTISTFEKTAKSDEGPPHFEAFKKAPEVVTLLHSKKLPIWLSGYSVGGHIHKSMGNTLSQFSLIESLVYLGIKFAILCTPNTHKSHVKFAQAFKKININVPSQWSQYLIPLIRYPSLSPPGSFIKHVNGSVQIILGITQSGLVTKTLSQISEKKRDNEQSTVNVNQIKQYFPAQPLSSFDKLNNWWGPSFEEKYSQNTASSLVRPFEKNLSLSSPPASLLVIQDQLNNIDTDIAVVTKAIETEPAYMLQLQNVATVQNRQKQVVSSVQHSIAMLGYERISGLLLEYSLLSRLNQTYFPLQKSLLMFSGLFATVANELAQKTKVISPEIASSTAYFATSRLFSLPQIHTLLSFNIQHSQYFDLGHLMAMSNKESIKNGSLVLANAWQQPKAILTVLKHYNSNELANWPRKTKQFGYVLGLSLTIAADIYFSNEQTCQETHAYINSAKQVLGLSNTDMVNIQQLAIEKTKTYHPFQY